MARPRLRSRTCAAVHVPTAAARPQGQYNQEAFDALDFIISEASKRDLRLVIALADNWVTDSNTDNKCAPLPAWPAWQT